MQTRRNGQTLTKGSTKHTGVIGVIRVVGRWYEGSRTAVWVLVWEPTLGTPHHHHAERRGFSKPTNKLLSTCSLTQSLVISHKGHARCPPRPAPLPRGTREETEGAHTAYHGTRRGVARVSRTMSQPTKYSFD